MDENSTKDGSWVVRLIRHWQSVPRGCSYLHEERAALEYRLMLDVEPEDMDLLLERGWRRFGPAYFRPGCPACRSCVPLRIPVGTLRMSRSQRRVWNRAQRFRLIVGVPSVDDARLELHRSWQRARAATRGWEADAIDAEEYFHQFAFPHPCVREFAYYDVVSEGSPRLVAVGIVDETPCALSAVYTFHSPEYHRFSLGTLSILFQYDRAVKAGKKWLYLGYRVLGCPSSEYKRNFRPHQLLHGWPDFVEAARWVEEVDEAPGILDQSESDE